MRIAIYMPNWIGDAVLSIPFINACWRRHPDARITLVAGGHVAPIFEHHPSIKTIIRLQGQRLKGFRASHLSGLALRKTPFDLVYLLSDSLRTAYLARLARHKERIGFRGQFRSPLLTHPVPLPTRVMHRADRYLLLLGSNLQAAQFAAPGITLTAAEQAGAADDIGRLGLSLPVAVFPASVAESRTVPLAKWVEFLEPILDHQRELLFIGSRLDRPASEEIISRLKQRGLGKALVTVCGETSLRQSIALVSQCAGAIATDSGLGHIAANLSLKTISLFGAGNPAVTRPLGPRTKVVSQQVHCSGCQKNACRNQDEPLLCLQVIPARAVWEGYDEFIDSPADWTGLPA